ncbi:MAG TPA: VCBS repeat-containing protein [Mycobacteriales bacterium]|nr:VCBS repeat-containing protein [Mycobacteriales bacterium]
MRIALLAVLLACTACLSPKESASRTLPTGVPTGVCAASRNAPPANSGEQRLEADLDGDGRVDELVSFRLGTLRVVQAWLADGRTAAPDALFAGTMLKAHDVDGDKRAEVFVVHRAGKGRVLRVVGCELRVMVAANGEAWEYAVGRTATLLCRPNGLVEEVAVKGGHTNRRAWVVQDGKAMPKPPMGRGPLGSFAGKIACGRA